MRAGEAETGSLQSAPIKVCWDGIEEEQLRKTISRALFLTALWLPAQLSAASVTYYYNSLDSNPDNFMGILTVQSDQAGQDVPILTLTVTAVVSGETLTFTQADVSGPAEAQYDTNPADPLLTLHPFPAYSITDPTLGGQELVLGPLIPGATSLGAPLIFDFPSSPLVVDASDNGEWLLTPPSSSSSAPEPSTGMLSVLAITAFGGFMRFSRTQRSL